MTVRPTRLASIASVPEPQLPRALTEKLSRPRGTAEEWFLGSLQARILRVLTEHGAGTVRDVVDRLPKRPALAYTTVMTVLSKLHKKGIVARERRGKGYVYRSRFTPDQLRDRMARYLVDELVDDFGEIALIHFSDALSRVDRRRLSSLKRSHQRRER